ncbi:MAG TPA: hypothetical protein VFU15_02050, partial [Bacteroidia bacterium]|nr:hypothetical protein [Bacteroidia bacterium]
MILVLSNHRWRSRLSGLRFSTESRGGPRMPEAGLRPFYIGRSDAPLLFFYVGVARLELTTP